MVPDTISKPVVMQKVIDANVEKYCGILLVFGI
jgi:hypothetical protein